MIFQSKIDRAMKWLKNKNESIDSDENMEEIKLDKTDILALVISALLVFSPIFIILILLIILVL